VERELDRIKVEYLEAYDTGEVPTLDELVGRHPQYRDELVDFVMTFIELENVARHETAPPTASDSTRRLRQEAVSRAFKPMTLREARGQANISPSDLAAAVHVPTELIVRVERGRLIPDSDDPTYSRFMERLGQALRRTSSEVLDILRTTFQHPQEQSRKGHARATGQPTIRARPAPQEFRALLEGCEELTAEQRHEWLG
jgi:hypothetical protein